MSGTNPAKQRPQPHAFMLELRHPPRLRIMAFGPSEVVSGEARRVHPCYTMGAVGSLPHRQI